MLTQCKIFADAFIRFKHVVATGSLIMQLREALTAHVQQVQTERLQCSLVSFKNWKTKKFSTYLRIQKYIKVNLIHTLQLYLA